MTDIMNGAQDCVFEDYDAVLTMRPLGNQQSVEELDTEIRKIEKALKALERDRQTLLNMLSDAELEMDMKLEQAIWDELMGPFEQTEQTAT